MVDAFVHITDSQRVTARVKAEVIEEGQPVKMYIDASKIHVFEPGEHGVNLTLQHHAPAAPEFANA